MAHDQLFKWLLSFREVGSPRKNSIDYVKTVLDDLKADFWHGEKSSQDKPIKEELGRKIQASVVQTLSNVDSITKSDPRIEIGCYVIAILYEILEVLEDSLSSVDITNHEDIERKTSGKPTASPNLISVQQTKVVEETLRVVMYSLVLGCLSQEASQYIKLMVVRSKFIMGQDMVSVSQSCCHSLLVSTMKSLLHFMKHPSVGVPLRAALFPEVLCALLELCFAPGKVKEYPKDTAFFREQLELVLSASDRKQVLQHLLLLKGMAKNGVWLQKVCGSLLVRRYLMQPDGVAAVIGAGLAICDGQDWKKLEAVAALIAHAKFQNMDLYYSTVGPQISEMMLKDNLQPEILHVVVLAVSELALRSTTLTDLHVTNALLQPLQSITNHQTANNSCSSSLTLSITRIHKLFVQIGTPSMQLMNLLQSIIDPLLAVAAFPTSHLRTLAQQCLTRYLSQQSTDNVIEILLHVCRLHLVSTIPTVNQDVMLCLDDEGGIKIRDTGGMSRDNILENDEQLVQAVVYILETLKNPLVVRLFYEKLVFYIDFSVLNRRETRPCVLLTEEDIRCQQFEAMRRVLICCSLLSYLADSEQLMNDLFQNLSEAIPIVDTLLKTSCQACDDEALEKSKVSFLMNVVMMVSCYVNEQMIQKKMCSEDWKGLKSLLPSLEEVLKNISDVGVLLFVEQLKNFILTHGVIKALPGESAAVEVVGKQLNEKNRNQGIQIKENLSENFNSDVKDPDMNNMAKKRVSEDHSETNSQRDLVNKNGDTKSRSGDKMETHWKDMKDKNISYKEAIEDIASPVLPIRGHALLALGNLVEERDSEALSHKEQLLSLFQHNLKQEDSYLYLMAIQGLAALCDANPDKVVETLTGEFSVGNRSAEDRTKLAEVLARASKRLGPVLPRYSSYFINSLLAGVRDTDAIVRASSLSSLGEVCKMLRFSLGPIIYEVFGVLQRVITSDKAVEVRRAAVLVVTLILQGLGCDAFSVLKDVIQELYRVLRLVHARDPDDVVRLHTQLAMEEIDTITKEFLLPKLNLTKRIFVADLPPNQF